MSTLARFDHSGFFKIIYSETIVLRLLHLCIDAEILQWLHLLMIEPSREVFLVELKPVLELSALK